MFKEAVLAILAAIAKQERIRISEHVLAGLNRARGEGAATGAGPRRHSAPPECRSCVKRASASGGLPARPRSAQ